ncbi:hypothetical protein [Brevibacillus fluminis]|nr:hypothetical protein [Brevibacillus fluminis]
MTRYTQEEVNMIRRTVKELKVFSLCILVVLAAMLIAQYFLD